MSNYFSKCLIEENNLYSVYYGSGIFQLHKNNVHSHYDADIAITYFKHCRATIKIEGNHYMLQDGDIIITNPEEVHCCIVEEGSFLERFSLTMRKNILGSFRFECPELLDCFYNRNGGEGNLIPATVAEQYSLGDFMESILLLSKTDSDRNRMLCLCKIIQLLAKLNDATTCPTPASVIDPFIADVIHYIGEVFSQNITCTDIANKFFISRFRLEHLFKASVGVSLWDYVILRRIMLFNELLQKGSSIKEAASAAGFHNYSNFYRLYKKHMNMTPMDFKKGCQS